MCANSGPEEQMAAQFELYKDTGGSWRWRLRATNGQLIASSGEAFSSKSAAEGGIDSVKRNAANAATVEVE